MSDAVPNLELVVRAITDEMAQRHDRGESASYIPELARVDAKASASSRSTPKGTSQQEATAKLHFRSKASRRFLR